MAIYHATTTDPRATELRELAASEGIALPMPVDMILWYEARGYVVDMTTGHAVKLSEAIPTASGLAVAYLLGDAPSSTLASPLDAELDALIDEVFGKPGLGVEDSAGIVDDFDYAGELEGMLDDEYHARGMW